MVEEFEMPFYTVFLYLVVWSIFVWCCNFVFACTIILLVSCYLTRHLHDYCITSQDTEEQCVALSATQSKVPRHTWRGPPLGIRGGHI